jgi:hypothetical protein
MRYIQVEVEVIKNCFNPDQRNMSKVVQGAREQVKTHLEHDAKLAKAGMHELARHMPPMSSGTVDAKHDRQHVPGTLLPSSAPKLRIVEGWSSHPKDDELPAPDIPKNDQELGDSPSKDDSQQSSDTEGADVEDNRGGGGDGSPTTPLDTPSEVPSPSPSPSHSPARSRSPAPILRASEVAAGTIQAPAGLRSYRRESFRRRLWGRSPFTREQGRHGDRNSSRSPAAARSTQSDAEESENDDDNPQRASVEAVRPRPHGTDIHAHHRSRSESPRRINASARNRERRHQKHQSEHRFELSPPESRDEVDDPRALSSAPSPNVLHQRLDTLAASAAAAASDQPPSATGSGSGESRQNSLSTSTSAGGRSRVQTLAGNTATGSTTRSIRFAEELGFERQDSSSSLSRMGSGGGGGGTLLSGAHQHLHYQHAHGARRSSPGPSGYTTPRSRLVPIGTPIGVVIGGGGGSGGNTPHTHGHASGDEHRHGHKHGAGSQSQKPPPLSELF